MPSSDPIAPPAAPGPSRRAMWTLGIVGLVAIVGMAVLVVWAISSREPTTGGPVPRFDRFESAWTSAMRKAGVEATFPVGPVEVTTVRTTGRVPFEATFTAEEVTALVNVYRYAADMSGQDVSLTDAEVTFPSPGVGSVFGKLLSGGSSYEARATAPLTYGATGISSPGLTELRVEGFSIGGSRRAQAGDALIAYLNSYLRAAPGLSIEQAQISAAGLEVKGSAPAALEHPEADGP